MFEFTTTTGSIVQSAEQAAAIMIVSVFGLSNNIKWRWLVWDAGCRFSGLAAQVDWLGLRVGVVLHQSSEQNELSTWHWMFCNRLSYLSKSIPIEFPPLSIAYKEYQSNLAIEEHSKFDLEHIINQTKDDQLAVDDLSHYVYSVLFSSHTHTHNKDFDYLNVLDWFLIWATIAGFLALILALVLHFKVRTLFLLLASSGCAHTIPIGSLLATGIYFETSPISTPPDFDPRRYQNVIKIFFQ